MRYAGYAESTTERYTELTHSTDTDARPSYEPTDLLDFEQVVAWFGVAPRTVERMQLPWSRPVRGGRLRRILFRDLVAHVERRKDG